MKYILLLVLSLSPITHAEMGRFLESKIKVQNKSNPVLIYIPSNYSANKSWPIILFLHGAGESQVQDVSILKETGLGLAIKKFPSYYPAIVVMPQIKKGTPWASNFGQELAISSLAHVKKYFNIDENKNILAGLSMGSFGGHRLLGESKTNIFKKALLIAGGVHKVVLENNENFYFNFSKTSIFLVHGLIDDVVSPYTTEKYIGSKDLSSNLAEFGIIHRTKFYENIAHNSWDLAFQSLEISDWLFK